MIDPTLIFFAQFFELLFRMPGQHFTIIIVASVLFFLLFIDFGIILKNFTGFSPWVAWIMALGLCIVAGVSGIIATIVLALVGIIGYIGATLLLIGLKVGATIIELSISKKIEKDKKEKKKREKFKEEIGRKGAEKIGETLIKIGKK